MYTSILVPIEDGETSERGLAEAISLAHLAGARLEILHVVDEDPLLSAMPGLSAAEVTPSVEALHAEQLLSDAARKASVAGVDARIHRRDGEVGAVAAVILAFAKKYGCSLIVMGTHGRRGLARLTMGSEAEQVVRESTVPVLLVPHRPA